MKQRKSINVELPLPQIGGGIQNQTGFQRHLAGAAIKQLSKILNHSWVQEQYVLFLKAGERERREKFKMHVAEIKAGKAKAVLASPTTGTTITPNSCGQPVIVSSNSKKAPVATSGKDGNGNE